MSDDEPHITAEHIRQARENLRRRDAAPYLRRAFWQGFATAMVPMGLLATVLLGVIVSR